jgi:hypothetical protein
MNTKSSLLIAAIYIHLSFVIQQQGLLLHQKRSRLRMRAAAALLLLLHARKRSKHR